MCDTNLARSPIASNIVGSTWYNYQTVFRKYCLAHIFVPVHCDFVTESAEYSFDKAGLASYLVHLLALLRITEETI